MADREILTGTTDPDQAGQRLDQAAAALFPAFSRARLQQWIRDGRLTVDGEAGKPAQRLAGGERLQLDPEPEPDPRVQPQAIALDLLYEDDDVIVVNKPPGLVVHPAAGNRDGTLQNALLHHDSGLAALPRAGIVHRLDKDTSGALVIARSLTAHASLVRQLQARTVSRIYQALAKGEIDAPGRVDAPIGRHPADRKRMAVVRSGRRAVTHYRVLQRYAGFTLLEVALETGRTHQIRVHLSHLGHPLVGDPVYARKVRKSEVPEHVLDAVRAFPRQALHAWRLSFRHPASGEPVAFEAPLPDDFADLLEVLTEVQRD